MQLDAMKEKNHLNRLYIVKEIEGVKYIKFEVKKIIKTLIKGQLEIYSFQMLPNPLISIFEEKNIKTTLSMNLVGIQFLFRFIFFQGKVSIQNIQ